MTAYIGGHGNCSGGLARHGLSYIDRVAATAVQVYVGNPRGWALPDGDPAQDDAFRTGCARRDVRAFIHASLLVNIGSPTPSTVERSERTLRHALGRATAIGAEAVVFHAGSAVHADYYPKAMRQVREVLLPLLDAIPEDGPRLLVEPSAGGGRSLASRVEHLGPYLAAVDRHPRLGVCLDTCHAWAAGEDLGTPGAMTATLDELLRVCGPGRLGLVHANDSRDALGSTRDRHENIGEGTIGTEPFRELLAHPVTQGTPVVVETPGDLHAADIALLRRLARPGK